MPAVIGREARKGRLRAYTADGHDGKVWLSDDFVYASEKVGEEARGRGAARQHGPVLVSATAPGGGDQYVNAADPGQRPLVRRHAAPHVAARRAVGCGTHCASLVGRQPPISYIYRGGVTTLRTREWSLISSPSRHGVHRMHGLDGAAGHRIETCRLCACTAQPLLRPKQLPGPPLASWTLTPFFQAVFATLSMMAAAITVRIHWRCAHVVQTCLGDHHRLLESSPPAHGRRLRRGCRALSPSASQWQLP